MKNVFSQHCHDLVDGYFFLNLKFEKLESSNHVERGKNNKF